MLKLSTYLQFKGNCREALSFYQSCLGGELEFQTIGESEIADQMPPESRNDIIHSTLSLPNFVINGSDMDGPVERKNGNDVSLMLHFEQEDDIGACFNRLAEGGQILDELGVKFWGDEFGVLVDKYGKTWMLIREAVPQKASV